jgi:alkylation response protein AidB-like acyl-CoA dehydrogenase
MQSVCRVMLDWATSLLQDGKPTAAKMSMTKLFVCDICRDVVLNYQQVLGASGYDEGFAMERCVRDRLVFRPFADLRRYS